MLSTIRRQKWQLERYGRRQRQQQTRAAYERETDENALDDIQRRQRNQRDARREARPLLAPARNNTAWADEDEYFDQQRGRRRGGYKDEDEDDFNGPRGVPPRWQNVLKKYVLNPYGAFAIAALVSVLNPQYIDKGRSNLAMQLYNRDNPGDIVAYKTKEGNLFKVSKDDGIITYNGKDGMVVDSKGGVWIAVARKDQPEIVKEKYYIGQIEDVPVLPENPTKGEQMLFDKFMQDTFAKTLQDVPKDLKKVYNSKDPEFILPLTEQEIAEDGYYFGDEEDWMARRD